MKKLIAIALLAVSAVTASAQMMTSRTLMKRDNPTTWYVRAGLSVNMLTGLDSEYKDGLSLGSKAGFEFDLGFNKPMGKSGAYWGMELGIGNRGGEISAKGEDSKISVNTWALKYSPVTFGYKYSVTDDVRLDIHAGVYASYDLSQKAKDNDGDEIDSDNAFDNSFDLGIQGGLGVWYKKINLDFTYQHGFVGFVSAPNNALKSSALMIRLGYAF